MSIAFNSPLALLQAPEASDDVITYLQSYSGRFFEPLAAMSAANRFGAADMVAVSCLSVQVPAETAGWLILGDGAEESARLLTQMRTDRSQTLVDHDLESNHAAAELWRLLTSRRDVGPTVASKLLAAKRPHLVPIFDSYVADFLLPAEHRQRWQWWGPWRALLTGDQAEALSNALRALRAEVAAAAHQAPIAELSDLRLIDIVIWMREDRQRRTSRKAKSLEQHRKPGAA